MGKSSFPIKPHLSGHLPPPSQGPADSQSTSRPPTPHPILSLSLAYATIDQGLSGEGWWWGTKCVDNVLAPKLDWESGVTKIIQPEHHPNLSFPIIAKRAAPAKKTTKAVKKTATKKAAPKRVAKKAVKKTVAKKAAKKPAKKATKGRGKKWSLTLEWPLIILVFHLVSLRLRPL